MLNNFSNIFSFFSGSYEDYLEWWFMDIEETYTMRIEVMF